MPRYDNHVRARASLARKVAQRRYDEGFNPVGRADVRWAWGRMPNVEDLLPAAYEALAAYKWPVGWDVKYSRYRIGGRPMFADGQTKNVPARTIHRIMVLMPDLPQFTVGVRKPKAAVAPMPDTSSGAAPESPTTPTTMNDTEFLAELERDVQEAQERVERLEREENDADERCIWTPLDDPDLQGYRDHSVNVSHKLEQAQLDLEKAQRWLELHSA